MSSLPVALDPGLAVRLEAAFDQEGKLGRALEALGPVGDRDVVVLNPGPGPIQRGLAALATRSRGVTWSDGAGTLAEVDGSADAVVGGWTTFRRVDRADLLEIDRVLRPGGRHLVVHDYGRDDVSRLLGERPEYGDWSHPSGPFLSAGFRVRVLHCWWTFDSLEAAGSFLEGAFGGPGRSLAAEMRRPRLSYNLAVYHRSRGDLGLREALPSTSMPAAPPSGRARAGC